MGAAPPGVRNIFRAALVIFVITVVIGILNGTDVWDPPRNTLLTHVHAGTLGWITLSVFGGAIWMYGGGGKADPGALPTYSIVAVSLYVLAFWSGDILDTTESIQRPIGGTLALIAILWIFVWALRAKRGEKWSVAEFGMGLSLAFLVLGAVLGVMLGLQLADVEVVAAENADRLGESHPGAMVAGFVVLAGLALIEWLMTGRKVPLVSESKPGAIQMLLLFVAGLLLVIGFLFDVEPLLQVAVLLQIAGSLVLLSRFRRHLAPSRWSGDPINAFVRIPILGLIAVVVLIAYLISEIVGGAEFEDLLGVALAMDHLNFIMVMTNLIFALMAYATAVSENANRVIFWGVNVGVVGFAVGLITESSVVKQIFTPIMGVTLLYGIYVHLTAKEAVPEEETASV
jgi:predicted membrane protein